MLPTVLAEEKNCWRCLKLFQRKVSRNDSSFFWTLCNTSHPGKSLFPKLHPWSNAILGWIHLLSLCWCWSSYPTFLISTSYTCTISALVNIMGKVKSPCCYLWLGNMPTSAWGADTLERWLENRLLPMAPIRYASCSLTTLGILRESSRKREEKKRKQQRRGSNHPKPPPPHLYLSNNNGMPKVYPAFTYQVPKSANFSASTRFYKHWSERHTHKTLQNEEHRTHEAGIYVCFQLI